MGCPWVRLASLAGELAQIPDDLRRAPVRTLLSLCLPAAATRHVARQTMQLAFERASLDVITDKLAMP